MINHKYSPVDKHIRTCIQRVATGPELSKNLTRSDAADAMRGILEGRVDPVQAAIFLIALRMKRETDDENAGILDGLLDHTCSESIDIPDLVEISDPYNGFVRGTPASSFLPAVLAALDIPAVVTGVEAAGPKYGVTHHKILKSAGHKVLLNPASVKKRIANPECGWGYLDQSESNSALFGLIDLRERMVKRTVITTLEVLIHPLRAKQTHLMTGFVHKPYPPRYVRLANQAGYASAMIVRGVEGGITPSLSQPSRYVRYDSNTEYEECRLDPAEMDIQQTVRMAPLPAGAQLLSDDDQLLGSINVDQVANEAAELGKKALQGKQGAVRDSLVYAASICLIHLGREKDFAEAASRVRNVLDNGSALARFTIY